MYVGKHFVSARTQTIPKGASGKSSTQNQGAKKAHPGDRKERRPQGLDMH